MREMRIIGEVEGCEGCCEKIAKLLIKWNGDKYWLCQKCFDEAEHEWESCIDKNDFDLWNFCYEKRNG